MIPHLTIFFTNHPIQTLPSFSALFGLIVTVLIFFFGVPRQIDTGGHTGFIALESSIADQNRKKEKIKSYKHWSFLGLLFIFLSFLLALIGSI